MNSIKRIERTMIGNAERQGKESIFKLTSFLEGSSRAWGVFEDRFGRVRRRFDVQIVGKWQSEKFTLNEHFSYDDGTKETRVWTIVANGPSTFTATCADCVGIAQGECESDSIKMTYKFRLQMESRSIVVDMEDRIYRVGDRLAVNRATMRKWGVKLGEVSLFFDAGRSMPGRNIELRAG